MGLDMPYELDRFDHAILRELSADGRISATELGRRIGLSKSPTQSRMKRLEEDGVITGYRARLNAAKIGLAHVAFVEVRLSDTREAALQEFNRAVVLVPEVEQCHMIASRFDYLLKVRTQDSKTIAAYWPRRSRRCPMLPRHQPMWRWRR